jgi:hypothetical protein
VVGRLPGKCKALSSNTGTAKKEGREEGRKGGREGKEEPMGCTSQLSRGRGSDPCSGLSRVGSDSPRDVPKDTWSQ